MAFEIFRRGQSSDPIPRFGVTQAGVVNYNGAAYDQFTPGWTHLVLGWDAERRIMGIKQTAKDDPGAYLIRRRSANSYSISVAAFLRRWGLKCDRGRELRSMLGDDGWVELELQEGE